VFLTLSKEKQKPSEDVRNLFDRKTYQKDGMGDSMRDLDSMMISSRDRRGGAADQSYYESDQENFKAQKI
jgi:hypothetical protein